MKEFIYRDLRQFVDKYVVMKAVTLAVFKEFQSVVVHSWHLSNNRIYCKRAGFVLLWPVSSYEFLESILQGK